MSIELADRLIDDLASAGITLRREGDMIVPVGRLTPIDLRRIRRMKPDLLRALAEQPRQRRVLPGILRTSAALYRRMDDPIIRLWKDKAKIEIELVGAVMCFPQTFSCAREYVTVEWFDFDGPRLCWLAAEVCFERGKTDRGAVYRLACAAIASEAPALWHGYRGESWTVGECVTELMERDIWSWWTVGAITVHRPKSPTDVLALRLAHLHERITLAHHHLRAATAAIYGQDEPTSWPAVLGESGRAAGIHQRGTNRSDPPETSTRRRVESKPDGQRMAVAETVGAESSEALPLHGRDPSQQAEPAGQASEPDFW